MLIYQGTTPLPNTDAWEALPDEEQRAIYADYGPNATWHIEGGLGTRSAVIKFQLRPDPLAK